MRRSPLWMCALLAIATSGCKQVSEQYAKLKQAVEQKIAERRGRTATPQPAAQPPTAFPPEPAPPAAGGAQPPAEASREPASDKPPAVANALNGAANDVADQVATWVGGN